MIYLAADDRLRLKSYTATTRGAKSVIRIELETEDTFELAHALRCLGETQAKQKAAAAAKRKAAAAPKRKSLALPAPRLALPAPEDRS